MHDAYDPEITEEDRCDMRDLADCATWLEWWLIFTFFAALMGIDAIAILYAWWMWTE